MNDDKKLKAFEPLAWLCLFFFLMVIVLGLYATHLEINTNKLINNYNSLEGNCTKIPEWKEEVINNGQEYNKTDKFNFFDG